MTVTRGNPCKDSKRKQNVMLGCTYCSRSLLPRASGRDLGRHRVPHSARTLNLREGVLLPRCDKRLPISTLVPIVPPSDHRIRARRARCKRDRTRPLGELWGNRRRLTPPERPCCADAVVSRAGYIGFGLPEFGMQCLHDLTHPWLPAQ